MIRKTTTEFIRSARITHGDLYNYEKVNYINSSTTVEIICVKHGSFWQYPHNHIKGYGCTICGKYSQRHDLSIFIDKARNIHGDTYDYSNSIYVNSTTPLCILCSIHGGFYQKPTKHLCGRGCPMCGKENRKRNKRRLDEYILRAIRVHGTKYDYSKVIFINCHTPVEIVCKKHGSFFQSLHNHTRHKQECPLCSPSSRAETKIEWLLKKHNIIFEKQKKFDFIRNPKSKRLLTFDFYLPEYNLCIEYDGEQHFNPWRLKQGGEERLLKIKERDAVKTQLCAKHDISLLRISFKEEDSLFNILRGRLKL
jgi:hypothetical protein